MLLIPGLFMLLNSLLTHNVLSRYSTTYKGLTYKDKHEVMGRVNCSLYQFYILYRTLVDVSYQDFFETNKIFGAFIFWDTVHYLFYIDLISNYLHHIFTILAVVFINNDYGEKLVIFNHLLFLFESTNPPMSISWIANKFGYNQSLPFKIFGTLTFLNWSFVRIFYFTYYIYKTERFEHQLLLLPFYALNLFWFKALVKVYLKVISK